MVGFLVYLLAYLTSLTFKRQNELTEELEYLLYPEVEKIEADQEEFVAEDFGDFQETFVDEEKNNQDPFGRNVSLGNIQENLEDDEPVVNKFMPSKHRPNQSNIVPTARNKGSAIPSGSKSTATEDEVNAAINDIYNTGR